MIHTGRAPHLALTFLLAALAAPALALDLALPEGATRSFSETSPTAGFRVAVGPFDGAEVPVQTLSGMLVEEIWEIPQDSADPAALAVSIDGSLQAAGFEMGFACAARSCGGFDFRHALPIPAEPTMYVDLGDFHYMTAQRATGGGLETLAVTVSRGGRTGYVHLVRIGPAGTLDENPLSVEQTTSATTGMGLIERLTTQGYAVLDDVVFGTGASALSGARHDTLVTLAAWLAEDPARRVVLVGHTDAVGALESNVALSRARAEAVRTFLIEELGADAAQVDAAGVGYLSPRMTNATPTGREGNRRVEVVLVAG
jgi:OOP family OmpA-OmpF porin